MSDCRLVFLPVHFCDGWFEIDPREFPRDPTKNIIIRLIDLVVQRFVYLDFELSLFLSEVCLKDLIFYKEYTCFNNISQPWIRLGSYTMVQSIVEACSHSFQILLQNSQFIIICGIIPIVINLFVINNQSLKGKEFEILNCAYFLRINLSLIWPRHCLTCILLRRKITIFCT